MSKNVIVTGGSRGIGKDIAINLAKSGYNVILVYNKSTRDALNIKENLNDIGIGIEIYQADLSDKNEIMKFVSYVFNKYKTIDILINNAGISQIKLFTEIGDNDWDKMIRTNLSSVFYLTREISKNMILNKNGCIINISSIWGLTGASCESHYAVTKAGIDAMTKSLAKELGPSNIRVNSIAPGIIDTDMNKHLSDEEMKEIINEIPLERVGKPADVTKCVKWLIDDDYVTGQVISINGGWLI